MICMPGAVQVAGPPGVGVGVGVADTVQAAAPAIVYVPVLVLSIV
jgi:hypothetical protein